MVHKDVVCMIIIVLRGKENGTVFFGIFMTFYITEITLILF